MIYFLFKEVNVPSLYFEKGMASIGRLCSRIYGAKGKPFTVCFIVSHDKRAEILLVRNYELPNKEKQKEREENIVILHHVVFPILSSHKFVLHYGFYSL